MKYICLGYIDPKKWETMSESERNAFIDECFAYDDVLRTNGHFVGGEALQGPQNAATLRFQNGKVTVHRWSLRGNQGATWRDLGPRGQGLEPGHPVDVQASGCAGRLL